MYCVIESNAKVVDIIPSHEFFDQYVKKQVGEAKIIENINEEQLKTSKELLVGTFLLKNAGIYKLVKKQEVKQSYLFGNTYSVDVIKTWSLLPFETDKYSNFNHKNKFYPNSLEDYPIIGIVNKMLRNSMTMIKYLVDFYNKERQVDGSNILVITNKNQNVAYYKNTYPDATIICGFSDKVFQKCLDKIVELNKDNIIIVEKVKDIHSYESFCNFFNKNKEYKSTLIYAETTPRIKAEFKTRNFFYVKANNELADDMLNDTELPEKFVGDATKLDCMQITDDNLLCY